MKGTIKVLNVAVEEFKELLSGNHALSLAPVQFTKEYKAPMLENTHTLFEFRHELLGLTEWEAILHARNIAYEAIILSCTKFIEQNT